MHITEQQKLIINLLKSYVPQTLAELSRKLDISKSSIDFQLGQLEKLGIVIRKKQSTKKIFYQLATEDEIESLIKNHKAELEKLLTTKGIEGLDSYKDLLNLVAAGNSEIWGYANLEEKIIPELDEFLETFRDKLVASKRPDYFTIPEHPKNIALLKDHFRKKSWKKYLIGRIISPTIIDVNCDIYVWDTNAGICSFSDGGFKITIHHDRPTVELYRAFLQMLYAQATPEEEYFTSKKK